LDARNRLDFVARASGKAVRKALNATVAAIFRYAMDVDVRSLLLSLSDLSLGDVSSEEYQIEIARAVQFCR